MVDVVAPDTGPPLWSPPAAAAVEAGRRAAPDPSPQPMLERVLTWVTRSPRHLRSTVSLSVSGFLVLASVVSRDGASWSDARTVGWHQLLGIGLLMLATILTRAIGVRRVVGFWLFGYFLVGPVVDGIGAVLSERMDGDLFQAGVVPVLEEGAKLAPVLLFALAKRRRGWTPAATDLALLGAALGGGFAFYEDLLWDRSASSGLGGLGLLFPTMLRDPFLAAGHVVWSACAALGVGVMVLHRRHTWPFVLGPLLLIVPLLDHAVVNMTGARRDGLRAVLLDGRLVPLLLVAGVGVAIAAEARIRRDAAARDHLLPTPTLADAVTAPPAPLLAGGVGLRTYLRRRNGVVYSLHAAEPGGGPTPVVEGHALGWLIAQVPRTDAGQRNTSTAGSGESAS